MHRSSFLQSRLPAARAARFARTHPRSVLGTAAIVAGTIAAGTYLKHRTASFPQERKRK